MDAPKPIAELPILFDPWLTGNVLHRNDLGEKTQGRFALDLATTTPNHETLNVNYNHNESEVVGVASNVRVSESGGFADAVVQQYKEGDRAGEIIFRLLNKTPYEASPTFAPGDATIEIIADGEPVHVNGRDLVGPLTIYRNVVIRSIAICPHGTDPKTAVLAALNRGDLVALGGHLITLKETDMSDTNPTPPEAEPQKVTSPELQELIELFGKDKAIDLYQAGVSPDELAQLKGLSAKFGLSLGAEEKKDEPAGEPAATPPTDPPQDEANLGAVLANLGAVIAKQNTALEAQGAQLAALKALVPTGEAAPVSHGITDPHAKGPAAKNLSPSEAMAEKYKRSGTRRTAETS